MYWAVLSGALLKGERGSKLPHSKKCVGPQHGSAQSGALFCKQPGYRKRARRAQLVDTGQGAAETAKFSGEVRVDICLTNFAERDNIYHMQNRRCQRAVLCIIGQRGGGSLQIARGESTHFSAAGETWCVVSGRLMRRGGHHERAHEDGCS